MPRKFDTPKTAVLARFMEQRKDLITGVTIDDKTGATKIFTRSDKWGDQEAEPVTVCFEGKTECAAINQMKQFTQIFAKMMKDEEAQPFTAAAEQLTQTGEAGAAEQPATNTRRAQPVEERQPIAAKRTGRRQPREFRVG